MSVTNVWEINYIKSLRELIDGIAPYQYTLKVLADNDVKLKIYTVENFTEVVYKLNGKKSETQIKLNTTNLTKHD